MSDAGATLPLAGLRVLDLTRLLPGGFCSMLLADFGADVVKVEDLGAGDYIRLSPPAYDGVEPSAAGALFLALNRGKRSIRLDLKSEGGRQVFRRLAAECDVVLESFRPGVMDRLGVGYETLAQSNPGLVYCAITGYGQESPLRDRPGHDLNYLGLNGVLALSGEAGGPPMQSAAQIADLGGGALPAAVGILIALRERERSGRGQLVDCSMFDGSLAWMAMVGAQVLADGRRARRGEQALGGAIVCYRPYACADGYVTLGALEPKFWRAFCAGVDREDLVDHAFDPPGSPTHRALEEIFAARTRAQWQAFATRVDCCLEPVAELDEALEGEQAVARGLVVELPQPGPKRPVRVLGPGLRLARTPARPERGPGPSLGEHTDEVLREAGYTVAEIAALHEAGAIAGLASGMSGSFLGA